MHGSEPISSKKRPAAMRSGTWATKTSLPDLEVEVLLDVARDELGRAAARSSSAARAECPGRSTGSRSSSDRADVAHVDLDVRERRRAEREDDRVGLGGVGGALRPGDVRRGAHDLGGARLLERHPAGAHRLQALGIVLDADGAQAVVGEGERERQADAAASDDGDVVAHGHMRLAARGWLA